jgi:hypothetical protein
MGQGDSRYRLRWRYLGIFSRAGPSQSLIRCPPALRRRDRSCPHLHLADSGGPAERRGPLLERDDVVRRTPQSHARGGDADTDS